MAGARNRRSKGKRPGFVPMFWELLNCSAYKKLPPSAAKALPYFLGKNKIPWNDPQYYLVDFTLSYPEGKKLGFSSGTFSKIIQDLIKHGFIDPVDKGGLKGNGKGYNIFLLSARWKDYGKPDFKLIDWKCFVPKPRGRPKA